MQFLITAYDGTDEGALDRRMSVRPLHLESVAKVKEKGTVLCAGGILDENGRMIGSALVFDLPSREALNEYLANEPYVIHGVWKDIRIDSYNAVLLNNEKYGA